MLALPCLMLAKSDVWGQCQGGESAGRDQAPDCRRENSSRRRPGQGPEAVRQARGDLAGGNAGGGDDHLPRDLTRIMESRVVEAADDEGIDGVAKKGRPLS